MTEQEISNRIDELNRIIDSRNYHPAFNIASLPEYEELQFLKWQLFSLIRKNKLRDRDMNEEFLNKYCKLCYEFRDIFEDSCAQIELISKVYNTLNLNMARIDSRYPLDDSGTVLFPDVLAYAFLNKYFNLCKEYHVEFTDPLNLEPIRIASSHYDYATPVKVENNAFSPEELADLQEWYNKAEKQIEIQFQKKKLVTRLFNFIRNFRFSN